MPLAPSTRECGAVARVGSLVAGGSYRALTRDRTVTVVVCARSLGGCDAVLDVELPYTITDGTITDGTITDEYDHRPVVR